MTSLYAEANAHSADFLMSVFVNELAPPQSTRSVCVILVNNYKRDVNIIQFSSAIYKRLAEARSRDVAI